VTRSARDPHGLVELARELAPERFARLRGAIGDQSLYRPIRIPGVRRLVGTDLDDVAARIVLTLEEFGA
jgi:hypothetical protein